MKGINYTNEQLETSYENFRKVHGQLEDIFKTIASNDGISLGQINKEIGVSDFIVNKCVAALQLGGFVELYERGTVKACKLTDDGLKMKKLIENRGK